MTPEPQKHHCYFCCCCDKSLWLFRIFELSSTYNKFMQFFLAADANCAPLNACVHSMILVCLKITCLCLKCSNKSNYRRSILVHSHRKQNDEVISGLHLQTATLFFSHAHLLLSTMTTAFTIPPFRATPGQGPES